MRALHTYVPTTEGSDINKTILQNMIFSVLCAKVHFSTIDLYTTNEIKEIVQKIGIPYDNIITEPFSNLKTNTFSIPKLITYSLQTEPFTHLDIDTFIYRRIDTPKNVPHFFAHPDIDMSVENNFQMGINLSQTYIKNITKIKEKIPKNIRDLINLNDIPNMNVFGSYEPKIVSEASKICLGIYEENKDFFDSEFYNACIIEQLLIPPAIKTLNEKYYTNYYLQKSSDVFRVKINSEELQNVEYPFTIQFENHNMGIENEYGVFHLVNYDFKTIVHLGGYKNLDIFQFFVRESIVERFNGMDYLIKLDKLFTNIIPGQEISERYYNHMLVMINKRFSKLIPKTNIL